MERKILKIAIIAILLVCVCSTLVSALSFTATMTPSKKVVPASTEFTVEIKVSNLDVGANGINSLSGYLKYDDKIFETISESSIEGRNGWSHSFNAENEGKITLTKTSFVKTEEEVFQVTFKTKSVEDLGENTKGLIQFTGITASNSASEITANDISVEISIGEEDTTSGDTSSNGTLQITPSANTSTNTDTNTNTNTNANKTIGLSTNSSTNTNKAANTNSNTNANTNTNTNTNTNKSLSYVSSTNTTEESIPYTGVEDTIMYIMFAVIAVAIVFYIKFERINKEMK